MGNTSKTAIAPAGRVHELNAELAFTIARLIGSGEKLAAAIPRLTLAPKNSLHARLPGNLRAELFLIPQGRKQVQVGSDTLTYDSSRYLLTSVDLPTITRVVEASEDKPCLAVALKLDISIVREFLAREEFHVSPLSAESHAMSTGPVTPEFLSAWCRLLDLLSSPEDIPFLSGFIEREIIYRILPGPEGARLRAVATLRRPEPPHRQSNRLDQGKLCDATSH